MKTKGILTPKIAIFVIIPFLWVVTEIVYSRYVMTDLIHVCGKFCGEGKMNGAHFYNIRVIHENKTYYYSIYRSTIKKNIDFDSLVKIECIDLQMSTIDHSYVDIVDKRVLHK